MFFNLFMIKLFTALFILGGGLCNIWFFSIEVLKDFNNLILYNVGIILETVLLGLLTFLFFRIKRLIKGF